MESEMKKMNEIAKDFNSPMRTAPISSTKQSMCHADFYLEQAEKFVTWFCRLPSSTTLTDAFEEWAASKYFIPADQKAIAGQVQHLLDSALDGPFDSKISAALDELVAAEDNT